MIFLEDTVSQLWNALLQNLPLKLSLRNQLLSNVFSFTHDLCFVLLFCFFEAFNIPFPCFVYLVF